MESTSRSPDPQPDRHQRKAYLVDDSRFKKSANGGDPAADVHVAVARRIARSTQRLV